MVTRRVEICANSATSCVEAACGGAYRVELCAGIPEGGTTPSIGEVRTARRATAGTGLIINAIIRPRGGDFLYFPLEVEAMKEDIAALVAVGVDGVVFGCLTVEGKVDRKVNAELMAVARSAGREAGQEVSTTFHRAFDVASDPFEALETIIELGFDRILTSGQASNAPLGAELIAQLVAHAAGRIIIMPGCGVNESNVEQLARVTGASEFHLSARHRVDSQMIYRNERVSMGGTVCVDEFSIEVTSATRVAEVVKALRTI